MNLTRTDIYRRLYWICRTHTAAKSSQHANCFAVGHDYELNSNNLWKGDIQDGNLQVPQFFWSRRWEESHFSQAEICKDFPLVFMSPGDRVPTASLVDFNFSKSNFTFDLMVFDLQNRDRNNLQGNEIALREREEIWQDTERILLQIGAALIDRDPLAIYNLLIAGADLGYPLDVSSWDIVQQSRAADYLKEYLGRGNWEVVLNSAIQPFDFKHNDIMAGVSVNLTISIMHDCFVGEFENRIC